MYMLIGIIIILIIITNFLSYNFFVSPQYFTAKWKLSKITGVEWVIYITAYALALLRLPFAILPYIIKLLCFSLLRTEFYRIWNCYSFQLIRICGDFANFFITFVLVKFILNWSATNRVGDLLVLAIYAELVRLVLEKGQMLFSAVWQHLPHRSIAQKLNECKNGFLYHRELIDRYIKYYILNDEKRIEVVLNIIKSLANSDLDTNQKLMYIQTLQIVSQDKNLRAGNVRDVANGTVFIHSQWTNDPWLLVGIILRRTPWMFDPRYLRRPFYYRTEANRLATLFVFQHAHYSPPYALYQFGHEIKAARYDFFYRLCRWFGINLEKPVCRDGTYKFDPLIRYLQKKMNINTDSESTTLLADEEVIVDIISKLSNHGVPSILEIASQYTYPSKYVKEILFPLIIDEAAELGLQNSPSPVDL